MIFVTILSKLLQVTTVAGKFHKIMVKGKNES